MVKNSRQHKNSEANEHLLCRIKELKQEHPLWGYRKVHAYLKYRDKLKINHKRVYRLMKENNLTVRKNDKLKAKRKPHTRKIRTIEPNKIWGIDMTKIMINGFGWAYLQLVLDWGSKKIVGYTLTSTSRSSDWKQALDKAVNKQFPDGIKDLPGIRLYLVSDHGSQPTSVSFMSYCHELRIEQIFTSYGNLKGNADTERVFRTLKEDLVWINEWNNFKAFYDALDIWIKKYNEDFPHSSIGYSTPYEYEQWFKAATAA